MLSIASCGSSQHEMTSLQFLSHDSCLTRYGDRVPISHVGQLFGVIWILMGIMMVSMFIGVVTTSLTSVSLETVTILYGTRVTIASV